MSHLVVSNILYHCGNIWCQYPTKICTVSQKGMLQALYIATKHSQLTNEVSVLHCTDVSQEEPHRSQVSYPSRWEELDQNQTLYHNV